MLKKRTLAAFTLLFPSVMFADLNQTPTLSSGQTLNLDTGAIASSGGDIQFTGGKITFVDTAAGLTVAHNITTSLGFGLIDQGTLCTEGLLFNSTPIAPSVNDLIGIHTNAGHYAKLWVTAVSGSSITIQFTTYTSGCTSGGSTGGGGGSGGGGGGSTGGGTPGGPAIAAHGVVNAASYADPRLPNGSIAEGSIFDVFGSGLGPASIVQASALPLQTNLGGTTISVTVSGTTVKCYMVYSLAGQIAAILPSNTPVGTGTITVTYNGTPSGTAPITVVKSSLGLFTVNQQGNGLGVFVDGDYNVNSSTFAFQPGETVVAWGTGLGPISGGDAGPDTGGNLNGVSVTVTVTVGGANAQVAYAGRAPGFAGEDQINFTIPQGVTGCNVPVAITTTSGGISVTSNYVTMAISSTLTCTSQQNYSSGFESALATGSVRVGSVVLNHSVVTTPVLSGTGSVTVVNATSDLGEAGFNRLSANAYQFAGFDLPYGACIILNNPTLGKVTTSPLDAGSAINISGPNGTRQLTESTGVTGAYFNIIGGDNSTPSLPLYFNPGTYTVNNGSGGKDVGGFNVSITVPAPFTWTNYSSITSIPRSQPLTVNWTGGDPSWDVYLSGSSGAAPGVSVSFECRAHNSDQTLTVPVSILQALPASASTSGIPLGSLTMIVESATVQTSGVSGLDLFIYSYSVEYQNTDITFQ